MSLTTRRRFLGMALGLSGPVALGAMAVLRSRWHGGTAGSDSPGAGTLHAVSRTSRALGTKVSITALHEDKLFAEQAITEAFSEIDLVEDVMSLYRPNSQLCRLNRDGFLDDPHPYLVEVLNRAATVSRASDGAFDVTVQPLWALYAAANKECRLPDAESIEAALQKVDWRRVEITARRITLRGRNTAITLNGMAQGFATDRATFALRSRGIEHALVDAGEIGSLGLKESHEPWKVGIQHPRRDDAWLALVNLDGRCLATSGDYATSFTPDHADHHIFDPHSGRSPDVFCSVSVAARTGLEADALSTAIFVSGAERGLELIRQTPGADALLVFKDGHVQKTGGFPTEV